MAHCYVSARVQSFQTTCGGNKAQEVTVASGILESKHPGDTEKRERNHCRTTERRMVTEPDTTSFFFSSLTPARLEARGEKHDYKYHLSDVLRVSAAFCLLCLILLLFCKCQLII